MEEENKEQTSALFNSIKEYVKVNAELYSLRALSKLADIVAGAAAAMAVLFFSVLLIVFALLALAFWLGELFNSTALGFLSVALFFGLVALIIQLFKVKMIKEPIANAIISSATGNDDEKA